MVDLGSVSLRRALNLTHSFLWDVDSEFMERNKHVFDPNQDADFDYVDITPNQPSLSIDSAVLR